MRRPLFTIITPALNCGKYFPRNIASIKEQNLPPEELEHWVIDGGSTDNTLEILRSHPEIKFISEKDRGLSDAVNKGIQRATGEWIIWLNADDELAPGALKGFEELLPKYPNTYLFCAGEKLFRYDGSLECINAGWDYNLKDLLGVRTSINQAGTIAHRSVYENVGLLDVACRYAMDYEWTVRAAHQFRCQPLPIVFSHYHRREGSIMDANMPAHYRTFLQVRRRYKKGYFDLAELRIRYYLATEPLRRIFWLRRFVRFIKRCFGCEPLHPMASSVK